jgi:hypothetical protein
MQLTTVVHDREYLFQHQTPTTCSTAHPVCQPLTQCYLVIVHACGCRSHAERTGWRLMRTRGRDR